MLSMESEDEAVWQNSDNKEVNGDEDFMHNEFATDSNRERTRRI